MAASENGPRRAPQDEGLVANLLDHDPRGLENLRQRVHRIRIRHDEPVQLVQRRMAGPWHAGALSLHVLHLAAASLRQGSGTIFQQKHVVAKLAPGANLPFAIAAPSWKNSGKGIPEARAVIMKLWRSTGTRSGMPPARTVSVRSRAVIVSAMVPGSLSVICLVWQSIMPQNPPMNKWRLADRRVVSISRRGTHCRIARRTSPAPPARGPVPGPKVPGRWRQNPRRRSRVSGARRRFWQGRQHSPKAGNRPRSQKEIDCTGGLHQGKEIKIMIIWISLPCGCHVRQGSTSCWGHICQRIQDAD